MMENFHGFIAVPLERYAEESGIDITADAIECGEFVDVMLKIIYKTSVPDTDFLKNCIPYHKKTANEIPYETAVQLFESFKKF